MGNPPYKNISASASNALDTRRVRNHVHKPVSRASRASSPPTSNSATSLTDMVVYTQSPFGFFSKRTGHRDVSRRGCIPTCRRSSYREAARWRVGTYVASFISFLSFHAKKKFLNLFFFVQMHLFGEGKICQSGTYKADPQTGIARLQRFRWGMCVIFFFPFSLSDLIPINIGFEVAVF